MNNMRRYLSWQDENLRVYWLAMFFCLPIASLADKSQQLLSSKHTFLADIKQEEFCVFAAIVSTCLLGSCFHNSKNVHFIQVIAAVGFMNQRLDLPGDLDPQWLSIIESCWHRLFFAR